MNAEQEQLPQRGQFRECSRVATLERASVSHHPLTPVQRNQETEGSPVVSEEKLKLPEPVPHDAYVNL